RGEKRPDQITAAARMNRKGQGAMIGTLHPRDQAHVRSGRQNVSLSHLGIIHGVLFLTNGLQASYRQPKGPQFAIYWACGLTQYHWPFQYNLVRSHWLTTTTPTCHR